MPLNSESGTTEGFAFVEYKGKGDADKAVAATHGWDFDKAHKLTVMRYDVFQEYQAVPDVFEPPKAVEWAPAADRLYWMVDEHFRDEFVIRYSNSDKAPSAADREKHETEVLWAETRGPPALDYGGEKQKALGLQWSTSLVVWSPQGTFLATMHPQGAKLWSGKGFKEGLRLAHTAVNSILWSPDEMWIATWNGRAGNDAVAAREALIVWDVRTGARVRAFPQRRIQDEMPDFSWSADSKYLARVDVDKDTNVELIRVYEAPTYTLLDNRSVKAAGARDLSWCPRRSNLLAYWTPERENAPTTVYVMRVPSKEYVRIRALQNVESVALDWHPQGEFLAIISEKLTRGQARKKKAGEKGGATFEKKTTAGFSVELMRLRAKDVPIEVLDIKEKVSAFAWEPNGTRFALMLGDGPNKYTVAFYAMGERGVPTLLFNLEDRALNTLHWSPRGEYIILAGLQSHGGSMEFYDVERRKQLNTVTHDVASEIAWDPSGRMVASFKTQPIGGANLVRDTVGNGYMLWSFQGARVAESTKPKMFQFLWRPRIEGLLSEEEAKDTAKNLKKFIGKYQGEDKQRQERKALLARLRKRKARDDFRAFLAERVAEWEANRPLRVEAGLEAEAAPEVITYEDVYEVTVSEEVTVVE
jgi:translation initiation factor 3 subunit B